MNRKIEFYKKLIDYRAFIRATNSKENIKAMRNFFKMMGIKKAYILCGFNNNYFITLRLFYILKDLNLETKICMLNFNKISINNFSIYIYNSYTPVKNINKFKNANLFNIQRLTTYLTLISNNFFYKNWIPVLKTLENCYSSISIIGENELSIKSYQYLKKNNCNNIQIYTNKDFLWNKMSKKIDAELILSINLSPGNLWLDSYGLLYMNLDGFITKVPGGEDYDIAKNILPYLNKEGIRTIVVTLPEVRNLKSKEQIEKKLESDSLKLLKQMFFSKISNLEATANIFLRNKEQIKEIASTSKVNLQNGFCLHQSTKGKYYNIAANGRITPGNKDFYRNKIFFFGPCTMMGYYVDDHHTIPAILRKHIDSFWFIDNLGDTYWNMHLKIRNTCFYSGDIVVILTNSCKTYENNGISVLDLKKCYNRIPDLKKHVCEYLGHCDAYVNGYIAREIYHYFKKNNYLTLAVKKREVSFFRDTGKPQNGLLFKYPELCTWVNKLKKYRLPMVSSAGAIVMNCNPFTYGHMYLIEEALKVVEHLFIFVVQEDKSIFPFHARYKMVCDGVSGGGYKNVSVIPSSKFIISSDTLPGYFEKENLQDEVLDATEDLEIFGSFVAPALNVKIRFVGEEPFDNFTRQYNEQMKKILPEYCVELIEIPRKMKGNMVISASTVRKFLRENNWEAIKNIVPPSTFSYLQKNYSL